MSVAVLVPGYGGRHRAVERWRVDVAVKTLAAHGGGLLVVSGHQGEAERLARLAPGRRVIVEPTARSTRENVERSLPHLLEADSLAIASDWFHVRRASRYLQQLRPDLRVRLVPAEPQWRQGGWWIQAGGAAYEFVRAAQGLVRAAR